MSTPLTATELPDWMLDAFDRICGRSPVALAVVDLTAEATAVVLANPKMEELFGAPLAGRTLAEFSAPDQLLDDVPVRARVVEGRSNVYERAKRYRRADGELMDLHVFGALFGRVRDRHIGFGIFTHAAEWSRRGYRAQPLLEMVLSDIRAALLRGDDEAAVLELVCQSAARVIDIDHAGVLALDEPDTLRLAAVSRGPEDPTIGRRYPVTGGDYDQVINARRTHQYEVPAETLAAYAEHLPESVDPTRPMFVAVTPMLSSGRTLGAVAVRRSSHAYEEIELELLEAFGREVGESLALASLREDQERLRMLEVREQIARNLHDEVTQDLIAVRLGLVHLVPHVEDSALREGLERTLVDLDDATRRLRDVVAGLDETTSADDFVAVLRSITSSKAERAVIDWGVDVEGPIGRLRDDERAELLRVVNEAVSNVVRHAHATRVDVRLAVGDASVRLTVDDDGVGLAAVSGRHSGIANLQARADARRGSCGVGARPQGGTRLEWIIPLGEAAPRVAEAEDPSC